jgi:membrane protein implicated in regulation of membrane protease activity
MPTWLTEISAFTVFLAIGAVGFIFLLVSLFFGELFEHFDHSFDHDHDAGGPSILSTRVLSVFVTAFGGFGALGISYGYSVPSASLMGFVSGLGFGAVIFYFAKFLYGQQATTSVRAAELTGKTARVIVSIPKDGIGQVRIHLGEELVDKVAKTPDGTAVSENTLVLVEQVLGEMVIVRPQTN